MQSFTMNAHGVFIHIHQGCFAGTGTIVRLPQCQWSKPDGYGKISQCITTTKHSKAKTVCIFLGIYCMYIVMRVVLQFGRRFAALLPNLKANQTFALDTLLSIHGCFSQILLMRFFIRFWNILMYVIVWCFFADTGMNRMWKETGKEYGRAA